MRIKETMYENDNGDLLVKYACEFCRFETVGTATNDDEFLNEIVPLIDCDECGKASNPEADRKDEDE